MLYEHKSYFFPIVISLFFTNGLHQRVVMLFSDYCIFIFPLLVLVTFSIFVYIDSDYVRVFLQQYSYILYWHFHTNIVMLSCIMIKWGHVKGRDGVEALMLFFFSFPLCRCGCCYNICYFGQISFVLTFTAIKTSYIHTQILKFILILIHIYGYKNI